MVSALPTREDVSGVATVSAKPLASSDAIRAERARILSSLLDDIEAVAEAGYEAILEEIPAYRALDRRILGDVRDQVQKHYETNLVSLLDDRDVTLEDISFVRGAATRRARTGFALEDYINAYRVGRQVLWDGVLTQAGATPAGHEAALTIAKPVMHYADFASTHAGDAYVEFQQYVVADADRERRDLLEHLLAGKMPTDGPLLATAQAYGIGERERMMMATAVPVGRGLDSDLPRAASAAIARIGFSEARTLVVVRQAEIVAVPVLGPATSQEKLCDRLESVQRRLRQEGMPLAMGISTLAGGVAELPRAYGEARAALELVCDEGGVAALSRLSPFEYLALNADETAARLVDPDLRAFLEEDRARGGVLTATIRAFADADLKLQAAAKRLQVHPNTARYRLRRIEERTGRNPRRTADLMDLLVAMALRDDIIR
jgi:PucR-like helix-turn-helix protein/diguanylate cyclase with GGDEF domain